MRQPNLRQKFHKISVPPASPLIREEGDSPEALPKIDTSFPNFF